MKKTSIEKLKFEVNKLFKLKKLNEELIFYEQILELNPNDILAICNIGSCLYKINELSKALKYFDQALNHFMESLKNNSINIEILELIGSVFSRLYIDEEYRNQAETYIQATEG